MRWTVHGERSIYESEWMSLRLVDVEVPGGDRFDHHVLRLGRRAAGTVVLDPGRGVLLLWRHRFITDEWGWEVPAGAIEHGELPEAAAAHECLEETGWEAGPLTSLVTYAPMVGSADQHFHLFRAEGAVHRGDPLDPSESERVEWVPLARVRQELVEGRILDGLTLTALLWVLTFSPGEGLR